MASKRLSGGGGGDPGKRLKGDEPSFASELATFSTSAAVDDSWRRPKPDIKGEVCALFCAVHL